MPQSDLFPPFELIQIVGMKIDRDPSSILVARSADIPGRAAFASDLASLRQEIPDVIEGYFAQEGEIVRVGLPRATERDNCRRGKWRRLTRLASSCWLQSDGAGI
jgi:hypothetical protein